MKKRIALSVLLFISVVLYCFSGCVAENQHTKYTITCEFSEADMSVCGECQIVYVNSTENAITALKFNLFGNAFRENAVYPPVSLQNLASAYPNGINYGCTDISAVTVSGADCNFSVTGKDENILEVPLEKEIFPNESVTVCIEFRLKIANVVARTGYFEKTVNLGNFYPILCGYSDGFYECEYYSIGDPFFSECADYEVILTYPSKYIVASSGKIKKCAESGEKTTAVYELGNARDFAFVLSKDFELISADADGVAVNYYYIKDENPQESLEYAVKSLNYFTKTFGEYAYASLAVVETNFVEGGMEYPALVMISDEVEKPAYGEVIVHETAHQWWYAGVGNNQVKYGFLDESLAEYSVVLFYENHPEYNMSREAMISSTEKTYRVFCDVYKKLSGEVDTTMLRALKDYKGEYEYVNIAYIKGCLMMDYLRQTIGEERFFKGIKKYYKDYCFKIATPDDLVGTFEKIGADTNGFFTSFFQGKVII